MKLEAIGQCIIQQYMPSRKQISMKFSLSPKGVFSSVNKAALPVIMLIALSNLPGADAGPLAYSACVIGCVPAISGLAGPASIACFNWCLALLPLPGP